MPHSLHQVETRRSPKGLWLALNENINHRNFGISEDNGNTPGIHQSGLWLYWVSRMTYSKTAGFKLPYVPKLLFQEVWGCSITACLHYILLCLLQYISPCWFSKITSSFGRSYKATSLSPEYCLQRSCRFTFTKVSYGGHIDLDLYGSTHYTNIVLRCSMSSNLYRKTQLYTLYRPFYNSIYNG